MMILLAAFSISGLASLLITPLVRDWARRRGWVDQPDSARKQHPIPIPRLGGIAIYSAILLSLSVVFWFSWGPAHAAQAQKSAILVGLAGLMLALGVWDDIKPLKAPPKFLVQAVIATLCWTAGFRILAGWMSDGSVYYLGILSLPVTLLWIVGITNAFNLIDGVDGLSSGAALLSTASLLVVSLLNHQAFSPVLLAALAGALVGFLKYNFIPASIFLGDSGSLLLGFLLALVAIENSQKSTTAFAIAIPIVAFGLPVLDTAIVILRRFLNGKPILLGDRRHIHHVLIERGLKPRNVVVLLYGVSGLFGLFSLLFMNPSGRAVGLALVILAACVWIGVRQLHYPELRELNSYLTRGIQNQRKLITGNVIIGRMIDGFRTAPNLSSLLENLSETLSELNFVRADVRLPGINDNRVVLRAKNWRALVEGKAYCLYQWFPSHASGRSGNEPERVSIGNDFRLEFVFDVTRLHSAEDPEIETGRTSGIGRLTFYHATTTEYPVSAVCLLSRNVWVEFGNAINRIMSQPNAGLIAEQGRSHKPEARITAAAH